VGPRGKVDEAGLSVPEDVYVVGYDNTYLADRALVSLTSRAAIWAYSPPASCSSGSSQNVPNLAARCSSRA
jgi:hypothetical protein